MITGYPADFTVADDGSVLVTFPDLSEALTFGTTYPDAVDSAVDCLEVALLGRIKDGAAIPAPSSPGIGGQVVLMSDAVARRVEDYWRESASQ